MRLVGLISGGKDSVYNMLQCIAAGHEIVAVANIEPETRGELDSYMYQSVGHEVISLIGGALCLPIFRHKTKGKALCKSKTYIETLNDEVEDLTILLSQVKRGMNIEGVAVGAIASDYQRTRVENVCSRLGLKCFAYLWRRNQVELLQEMIDADVEAIIVKVASIGLELKHLGMTIREIQPLLLDLHERYGMNVCGEGGEYETITVDSPLFHRSIAIIQSEKVLVSDDAFAPVGFLNVQKANLSLKSWETDGTSLSVQHKLKFIQTTIKNPYSYVQDCFDELSEAIFPQRAPVTTQDLPFPFEDEDRANDNSPAHLEEYWKQLSLQRPQSAIRMPSKSASFLDMATANLNFSSGWCFIGNVIGSTILEAMQTAQSKGPKRNLHIWWKIFDEHLQRMNYDFQEVVFVNIYMKDLSEFGRVNSTYSNFMPEVQPPARACVAVPLPPEIGIILSLVAHKTVSRCKRAIGNCVERETMHVQSISHWAPANIGPYSQCIRISGIYYVAGQIPLIPGTMEILNKPIIHQCKLTLRHVLRILQAMNEGLDYSNIFNAVCYVTAEELVKDMGPLWLYLTKVNHTALTIVAVSELPKKAQMEWEVVACDLTDPSVVEEVTVVEEYQLYMKRCVYKEPFTGSITCKISYLKKSINKSEGKGRKSLKFITANGLSAAVKYCVDFLKKDFKSSTVPLCTLKLFYKSKDYAIPDLLSEVIPSLVDSKVVATAVPVVACEQPDIILAISGWC